MMLTRDGCPACGGAAETLYRCAFDKPPISTFLNSYYGRDIQLPGEYRADQCLTCGTIYQAEVGDDALLTELYDEWIPKSLGPHDLAIYQFDTANPRLSRDGHEIMSAAAVLGVPLSEMVTLDFGTGWASWARISRALGCRSYGVDLAPGFSERAAEHGVLTDIGGEKFHFINTEQVMEHVTDPRDVVADLLPRLRPGGILKISVPSDLGILQTLSRLNAGQTQVTHAEIVALHPLEHVNCFTMDGLRRLTGMEPVRVPYRKRYAFLRRWGLSPRRPRNVVKELVRPFFTWRNSANLYVWFRAL